MSWVAKVSGQPVLPWAAGAVTVCAGSYVVDPHGIGGVLFTISAIACIGAIAVGPVWRQAQSTLWLNATAGGLAFLLGLVARLVELPAVIGPLSWADAFCFLGYLFLARWLAGLLRHVRTPGTTSTVLDTTLVAVGASLALWTITISPTLLDTENLGTSLVSAVYPVLDVVLLTQSVQLAFRVPVRVPAMWAFLAGLVILQLVDTAYTFVWVVEPGANIPALTALFLYAYLCFAVGMCHPSVADLDPGGLERLDPPASRRPALLLSTVSPAILSIVYPLNGPVDGAVRAAMMAAIFGLLFRRLSTAMASLASAEADSRHRAMHDPLTGLPNRASFVATLERRLARSRPDSWVGVLFVDCDNFKYVNDTWGHQTGDALLAEIAGRLADTVRRDDFLARLGGDEFVIVAVLRQEADAAVLANRIMAAFEAPMLAGAQPMHMTPSIGISVSRAGSSRNPEYLVREADMALYEAKERGRAGWAHFTESLRTRFDHRAMLAEQLRTAVAEQHIDVDFQPIMAGPGYQRIVGWEALARWRHRDLGVIGPDVFIPLAEQTGLIRALGEQVLRRACHELARIRAESGRTDLHVSVNLSPLELAQDDLVGRVRVALLESGLPADALWLEITESTIVERGESMRRRCAQLHELGVALCVDDFGTGYSSLATLPQLSVDYVKLDRLFVANATSSTSGRDVLRAILLMTSALGVKGLIAEGVESPDQTAVLVELDCHMVQGFLFGRPVPARSVHMPAAAADGTAIEPPPRDPSLTVATG